MKLILLAALVAVVTSDHEINDNEVNSRNQFPWQVGKIYRYNLKSYTVARLQEGASSGAAFQAHFVVRVKSFGHLQAKLENPQHASVHHVLPNNREMPSGLQYQHVKNLDMPFEINVDGGRIRSLRLPTTVSLEHENLLKGLVGALQVDLSQRHNIPNHHDYFDNESKQGLFKKIEEDVTGSCETLYTLSPVASEWHRELPNFVQEEPIEITKSKNYGHCDRRVDYHFGIPEEADWSGAGHGNQREQFIRRATVSRVLAGKNFHIYKSEVTSTVHVHPHVYGKQKAEVISNVLFELTSLEQDNEKDWHMSENVRNVISLMYSMSSRQVLAKRDTDSPLSVESSETKQTLERRLRRSAKTFMEQAFHHNEDKSSGSSSSSSSSSSESAHVNDEIPDYTKPVYSFLYMTPESYIEKKQNPVNAQKLIQEIAQELQKPSNLPKTDMLSKFNILVREIASLHSSQLNQIEHNIETANTSNKMVDMEMKMVFRDALLQSGTLPAFQKMKSWIKSKKIKGEEAADCLATFENTLRYPTKDVMIQFFKLALSPEVSQQNHLNSTALIVATSLINKAQVNNYTAHSYYPTHMYGRLSKKYDRFVLKEILPRLQLELDQAIQRGDNLKAQVYIKAIGNIGHREVINVFAKYLEGKVVVSTYLRTLIVESLQILAAEQDHQVRNVLYSILRNTAEAYEVRIAAIQLIYMTHPTISMMQLMAQMTHNDPSVHVRSALKSSIEYAAELKYPRFLDLAKSAKAVLHMVTKENLGSFYSNYKFYDFMDQNYELGGSHMFSYIGSQDSLYAKQFEYASFDKVSGWHNEKSVSAMFSSVRKFVDSMKKLFGGMLIASPRSTSNHKYSAEKIAEMLQLKRSPETPLEASLYLNFLNQKRFFAFDESNMKGLEDSLQKFFTELTRGTGKYYTKIANEAQISVMFPLAMGVPFVYKYKEPTLIRFHNNAKGVVNFPTKDNRNFSANIYNELHFTFAKNIDGSVGFFDTLVNQFASAGVISKYQFNTPIKMQINMLPNNIGIDLEPLIDSDKEWVVAHYSVWPYTANQKKNSLTTIAHDPNTKVVYRSHKVFAIDEKFGQSMGINYELKGYSYSKDFSSTKMLTSPEFLSNFGITNRDRDLALTHFNLKHLEKQSPNNKVTLKAFYDIYFNQTQGKDAMKVEAIEVQDMNPNSKQRHEEMIKRVTSGINTAKAQLWEFSASFEGSQPTDYVITAAIAGSPVDQKIQYVAFAGRKSSKLGNRQINAAMKVVKPHKTPLNFLKALKKEFNMTYEADIKCDKKSNIYIQGNAKRTNEFAEKIQNHPIGKQCAKEIARNNLYQHACHLMTILAHTPDYYKTMITYNNLQPSVLFMTWFNNMAKYFDFWHSGENSAEKLIDGQVEIETQKDYLELTMNVTVKSKTREFFFKDVPIHRLNPAMMAIYSPFRLRDRVFNEISGYQYQPYCTVDGSTIHSFSNRSYEYPLTRSWHVVMHDEAKYAGQFNYSQEQLVILARRPDNKKQEVYISYSSDTNMDLEMEIQPATKNEQPNIKLTTKAQKISEGDMTIYWNPVTNKPFVEYYMQHDGVLMLNIDEDRVRMMYDGERLVVLSQKNRGNVRGLCGYMSGDQRDDYFIPEGIVDRSDYYGAAYTLDDENSDPNTKKLKEEAKKHAYQPKLQYTVLPGYDHLQNLNDIMASVTKPSSKVTYNSRAYGKSNNPCELKQQVQYYENHGEICISMSLLPSCQTHCKGVGYTVIYTQVVCRPKKDHQFVSYRNQIRKGENPNVSGTPQERYFKVPSSCKH